MDIGEPQRVYTVEPVAEPIPDTEPLEAPAEPPDPVELEPVARE
jgi:hypothetical protein